MKAAYGSHSEEEGRAFVEPSSLPVVAHVPSTRRVILGASMALLGAAAATAAIVACVDLERASRPIVATMDLTAATLVESLATAISLDDNTAFDTLDVDGDGVVTKREYLDRLTARRTDVLAKLELSNVADDVKQPIATMIRDNFDDEAACVANVFDLSGGRVVDKATFEFVHPLISSLCKKSLTSGLEGTAGDDQGGAADAPGPPRVDIDGNVIQPPEDATGIDGTPANDDVAIDGTSTNEDIGVDGVVTGDDVGVDGIPTEDDVGVDGIPTGNDVGIDGTHKGEGIGVDGVPGGEDLGVDGEPTGDDVGIDGVPTDDNVSVDGDVLPPPPDSTTTDDAYSPPAETNEPNDDNELPDTSTPSTSDEDALDYPPGADEQPDQTTTESDDTDETSSTTSVDTTTNKNDAEASENTVTTGEDTTTKTNPDAEDIDTDTSSEDPTNPETGDVDANASDDVTESPETGGGDDMDATTGDDSATPGEDTAPLNDSTAYGNDETTDGDMGDDDSPRPIDESPVVSDTIEDEKPGGNDVDVDVGTDKSTPSTESATGDENGGDEIASSPDDESVTPQEPALDDNDDDTSTPEHVDDSTTDIDEGETDGDSSSPAGGDDTAEITSGSVSGDGETAAGETISEHRHHDEINALYGDQAVVHTFPNDLRPPRHHIDGAPQQKSLERLEFEHELAKGLRETIADHEQRLAYASLQVKKNAFMLELLERCITNAGRQFEFNASYSREEALEWVKSTCLVFPDVFKQKKEHHP